MKPTVHRLSTVPLTALLGCPRCTHLVSYRRGQEVVVCHACGTTVKAPGVKTAAPSVSSD